MRPQLVRWQWEGYPQFHGSKVNLWIHIFAVPWFILSALNVVWALVNLSFVSAAISFVCMLIAFALQAIGHKQEHQPAIPFDGPADAVGRIFTEQFFTFPRFVLTGGWWRAMRGDKAPGA